jgi:formylglycine-generating enzyme required for sulfatase activity
MESSARFTGWLRFPGINCMFMAAAVAASLATPTAFAQPQDWTDCSGQDAARAVAACSRIIGEPGTSAADRADAYLYRAGAELAQGGGDRALADYTEAIRLSPQNPMAYASRALAYFRKGDRDHAIADYRAAQSIDAAQLAALTAGNPELAQIAALAPAAPPQTATAAPPGAAPSDAPPAPSPVLRSGPCGTAVVTASFMPPSARAPQPLSAAEDCSLRPKDLFMECEECPQMVVVPAGSFKMGSPTSEAGREKDEGPQHTVTIETPFAVGSTHVTLGQFAAFVNQTGYDAGSRCQTTIQAVENEGRSWQDPAFAQDGSHPVVCVSWNDAQAYVAWLSRKTHKTYRLLTEAEWEYAARAGTSTRYFFGNDPNDLCRYANVADQTSENEIHWKNGSIAPCEDGYAHTAPAGSFLPNAFGLYDMLGNAGQWVQDCYHNSYAKAPSNGSAWSSGNCRERVYRGHSWKDEPKAQRVAFRDMHPPGGRNNTIGFRVARTLGP